MGVLTGISGTLLPERYVADQLLDDVDMLGLRAVSGQLPAQLARWWTGVEAVCGPASSLRTLFDRIAMPLCAMLGFSAHDVLFDKNICRARLATRRGTIVVLILTTWATRPSARWADVVRHAHEAGAEWGFILAPPFLSVVPVRGHGSRRSIDITLPEAATTESVTHMLALVRAAAFDPISGNDQLPARSALDRVLDHAAAFQDRVRVDLQRGVELSLNALYPVLDNPVRMGRTASRTGVAVFDEALTLVYRVLFLLFVESRHLVPRDNPIYRRAYAISRFCRDAARGSATGLWDALAATSRLSRIGCQTIDLRLGAFNGALFARSSAPALERRRRRCRRDDTARLRDEAVRQTLVALGFRSGRSGIEAVHYRDLGVEQLGAVYERVLDFSPDMAVPPVPYRRGSSRRHSVLRKETGTFYTPQPIADYVVRRTLAPLTEGASSDAILALRIVDPAMGSGAFLVAACRFLAAAYENALIAEGRLAATDIDDDERANIRRLVAETCLSGVDRNPTAVHLARLSLWLTTLARDKPLGFLDHRLRVGNSLIGAWPSDLHRASMRSSHGRAHLPLFQDAALDNDLLQATRPLRSLLTRRDDTVADVRAQELDWRRFQSTSSPLERWRVAAHLWCARWFLDPATSPPGPAETRALLDAVLHGDRTLPEVRVAERVSAAMAVARDQAFFHWPFEFPDIFFHDTPAHDGGRRGYDAVLGNPPWEMLHRSDGTDSVGRTVRYVRQSGQFPSCVAGHLNLYQAFVDRAVALTCPGGRIGLVLPWGIAADDGAATLRRRLFNDTALDTIVGVDNANRLFPIHSGLRFAVVTTTTGRPTSQIRCRFGVRTAEELDMLPARGGAGEFPVNLTPSEVHLASGPLVRIPDARRPGDLSWLLALNQRFPRLGSRDGWGVSFGRELNATEARPYLTQHGIRVIEGKHLAPFVARPPEDYCLDAGQLARMIEPGRIARPRLGYRDVSGVGNKLTLIAAVIPAGMVTTHTVLCLKDSLAPRQHYFLCALFNSYVLNAVVRLLMGGHVTTTLAESLPAPRWRGDAMDRRIAVLADYLGENPADTGRAAEVQALVAHRYGLTPAELDHVLGSFPHVASDERAAVLTHFRAVPVERAW